ncbi:MAG: phage tail protein [Novosphingobium sp.]
MTYPLTSFNFAVEIYPDGSSSPLAEAAFADCDGIELTMDVKTIREGGANDRAHRVPGAINYSNLTLKRGVTANLDLWGWVQQSIANPGLRANAEVIVFAADGSTEAMRYQLHRCLPIKFKAPALSAKDGQVAIEEFQLAYEKFVVVAPKAAAA